MTDFNVIQASGRYDRTVAQTSSEWAEQRTECGVILRTEAGAPKWETLIRNGGWAFYRPEGRGDRADTCIEWDPEKWRSTGDIRSELLSPTGYLSSEKLVYANVVPLERASGGRCTFMSIHFPSSVEQHLAVGHERASDAVIAWNEAVDGLRRLVNQLQDHDGTHIVVGADWNVDFKNAWVRDRLHDELATTGLHLGWDKPEAGWASHPGSHGSRLIDGIYTDLPVVSSTLRAASSASDHRSGRFKLSL